MAHLTMSQLMTQLAAGAERGYATQKRQRRRRNVSGGDERDQRAVHAASDRLFVDGAGLYSWAISPSAARIDGISIYLMVDVEAARKGGATPLRTACEVMV